MPEAIKFTRVRLAQIFLREGHNPREDYGQADGSFAELVASIKERGMLLPPMLRAADHVAYRYYVVAGHRRIAAAKALKMPELICACLPHKEDAEIAAREDLLLAMVENLQRKDLSAIEQATAFQRLLDQGLTQTDIARWLGVSQPLICNTLALLRLPEPVQAEIKAGALSKSHGEELVTLVRAKASPSAIKAAASEIKGKSVRDSRLIVESIKARNVAPTLGHGEEEKKPFVATPCEDPSVRNAALTEEQLVRWATKQYGSVREALRELKNRVEESAR